ncbi:MAG TPA: alpha/beta hydrolase [Kofleriaceae bacterium]|nr:alpha/beta hydrolase [Kofleriaceae bacterium]
MISTRLGEIVVETTGQGPLVLLVPAAGRAAADFAPVIAALAARFEVATIDWPSHGASPSCARPHDATALDAAAALREVADALGRPAIVIGHSLGGFAAAKLAIDAPARVRALVLIDALGFFPFNAITRAFCVVKGVPAITRATERWIARGQTMRRNAHTAKIIARVDDAGARADYVALTAALWRSFPDPANDLRKAAAAIRCPTLVTWGRLDPVIPVFGARNAVRAIPGAELALFTTGHSPFAEDPARFAKTLTDFLDRAVQRERSARSIAT